MSATLLLCALAFGTRLASAYVTRNGADIISTVENETSTLTGNGVFVRNPHRRIVVEEVDKHGNSVVKELELPDYDEERDYRGEIEKRQRSEKSTDNIRQDLYGCDSLNENQWRKCLRKQKKFLKNRYRNWKTLIRRIIKDLDGKIKTVGHRSRRESAKENLNFMSGLSPKNVMRKKE